MLRLPPAPVFVAVCLVLGLAACADDDTAADPTADATVPTTAVSTSTTSSPTTAPAPTPEQEVEAAYLEAAAVLDRTFRTSNPTDAGLQDTRLNPSLAHIQGLLTDRKEAGAVLSYPDDLPPLKEILEISITSANTATIDVCVIDNAVLIDENTGQVLDDAVTARLTRNQMRLDGQVWKVESVDEVNSSVGASSCEEPDTDA